MINKDLKNRILEISKKLSLSHIGSNLSVLSILEEIYSNKRPEDIVILDNAHAHLAHMIVRENIPNLTARTISDAYNFIIKFGIHCDRQAGCDATGGSLGHGIGIGIGYAIVNRKRQVNVIVSDGSMMEGSNWEALRIINQLGLHNITIHLNFNGYTAVSPMTFDLVNAINGFDIKWIFYQTENGKGFEGVQGHYKIIGGVK